MENLTTRIQNARDEHGITIVELVSLGAEIGPDGKIDVDQAKDKTKAALNKALKISAARLKDGF